MAEVFYPGQKDYIYQLNQLVGRGAVVGALNPTAGKSPIGAANGFMNPAWLDPNIPIKSDAPISAGTTAKYGFNFSSQGTATNRWLLIATMNEESAGEHANLLMRGVFNNNWAASTSSPFTIFMGVRSGFYVDWHIEGPTIGQSRIVVVQRADGKHDVYAFFESGVFSTISFDLTGINTTTYAVPVETNLTPTGTVVFDSSNGPANPIYIAPRWQGSAGKKPGAKATMFNDGVYVGQIDSASNSFISAPIGNGTTPEEVMRLGVGGYPGFAYPGHFGFMTVPGNVLYTQGYRFELKAYDIGSGNWTPTLFSVKGDGAVYMPLLKAGSSDASTLRHNISRGSAEGNEILYVGRDGAANPSIAVLAADGAGGWNVSGNVLYVGKNSSAGRSISAAGTVNTMGNDYAEYIRKTVGCAVIIPGTIIGITATNEITDKWADAVMFATKSTAPSFVGGDTWAKNVGPRPSAKAGTEPIKPVRIPDEIGKQEIDTVPEEYVEVVVKPGDTDEEWEAKVTNYETAVAEWEQAVEADRIAVEEFEVELEAARSRVDRIAIAGRVPVNVYGASPGDYIIPVQDGNGIKGIAVAEDDITLKQYLRSVGQVITIEADGRAYVMVKSA